MLSSHVSESYMASVPLLLISSVFPQSTHFKMQLYLFVAWFFTSRWVLVLYSEILKNLMVVHLVYHKVEQLSQLSILEFFTTSENKPCTHHSSLALPSRNLLIYFLSLWICLCLTFNTNGVKWYVVFMPGFFRWHDVLRIHPCASMCWCLIPFYD